ncbi:tetratricopeptide repeat protein [Novosphingobium aquae]|uniref:Tetratricopeptide repeat protein n=1 Tax=Novosphingobium aquae TaxID=3133435 RepID=A0ABU8SFR7_9SPHN
MVAKESSRSHYGRLVLLLATVIAVIAIAVSVQRKGHEGGETNASAVTGSAPASDPVATLELHTREKPQDSEAWSALASAYFDTGRFDEAVKAYDPALKLAAQRASLWSARGEARVMASVRDPMPAAAVADFEQAIRLDPKDPRARYFLAVRQDLGGDHEGAINSWLALLADTPPGAVWEADLKRTIVQAGKINAIAVTRRLSELRQPAPAPRPGSPGAGSPGAGSQGAGLPGPSAEDLRRASAIPPREQRKMAEGMVTRLEARLRTDPANVEGWIMLIRSRLMLGQADAARAALDAAVKANPQQANRLREQASAAGLR